MVTNQFDLIDTGKILEIDFGMRMPFLLEFSHIICVKSRTHRIPITSIKILSESNRTQPIQQESTIKTQFWASGEILLSKASFSF